MSLSNRLKQLLTEIPMRTQAGLARHVGVAPASVSEWVSGKTKAISSVNLVKAAEYFGVTPSWLASGEGQKWGDKLVTDNGRQDPPQESPEKSALTRQTSSLLTLLYSIPPESRDAACLAAIQALVSYLPRAATPGPAQPDPQETPPA